MSNPTVGRIVHFYEDPSLIGPPVGPWAAIVNQVREDGSLDLMTFAHHCFSPRFGVRYSAVPRPGCWTWPPMIPAPSEVK